MSNDLQKYVDMIASELKDLALCDDPVTDEYGEHRTEDGKPTTIHEYVMDALDVCYTINSRGGFLDGAIAVTLGGPNVWVETGNREVVGYWGGKKATAPLHFEAVDQLYDVLSEMHACL